MAPATGNKKAATQGKTASHKFIVDFSGPADNKIFDSAAYEQFLIENIKVDGKTGQLGESVSVQKEGSGKIAVTSSIPMSKRYVKYLTKRFLKRNQLREWLRVVSTSPNTYTLKFFETESIGDDEE